MLRDASCYLEKDPRAPSQVVVRDGGPPAEVNLHSGSCDGNWSIQREARGLRRVVQQLPCKRDVISERVDFDVRGPTAVVAHVSVSNCESDGAVRSTQVCVRVTKHLLHFGIDRLLDQQPVVLLRDFVRSSVEGGRPVSDSGEMLTCAG